MKQIGIWLDYSMAEVIKLMDQSVFVEQIPSEIEHRRIGRGARSKSPWGPMDKVSESKLLERRKHQVKRYYEAIWKVIKDADEVYVMGPAEAKIGFQQFLEEQHGFQGRLKAVETVDSISPNQRIAKVRAFFGQ